jgi:hypothetical protein
VKLIGPALVALLALPQPPRIEEEVVEPRTGVHFTTRQADTSLLGVGVRTKTIFGVKVYAIGLYVADAALAGPLAAHKGKLDTPEFYRDLIWGDFDKRIIMRFVRNASREQVQENFRQALPQVNPARLDVFASHMIAAKAGQEYVIRWAPGGILETSFGGQVNTPIADKDFAAAVFGIWLRQNPIQADVKRDLVSRAPMLIR